MQHAHQETDFTVAQSVRNAVKIHSRSVLRVEECTRSIVRFHNGGSEILIRQALIQRLKKARQVAEL